MFEKYLFNNLKNSLNSLKKKHQLQKIRELHSIRNHILDEESRSQDFTLKCEMLSGFPIFNLFTRK